MKRIVFHLDFVSPYAFLAFEQLPRALEGLSWEVELRPVLFAAMLRHHGQLGPAEIPAKREWTYRQVLWTARTLGVPLHLPAVHPFNPLSLLRLALACGEGGRINRYVAETVFRHAWLGGGDAADPQRLAGLRSQLAPARDPDGAQVKAELRANTDAAIAAGVFGVPTFEVDGHRFWGLDALPMLRAFLEGDAWFDSPQWHEAGARPGVRRSG
ncbi:2-hydroxychromene-2-carboxylate isomerase [Ramlibacter rhizophilus]|uniref:2-hydroxychromene-2-carboxylate isomerase n=1 Tax=Ramlibacter rhizophilus TaxID=1781167 RepID=A0A4Z0BNJ1_9BURK|nr:2-hydroxychromene-2-carboxylate isomerase [Ramlibacter rhizophilus]TFY99508.1 2-hydroxychromene-2-carboxylate isomerase [Ramlibacter rhizophilus]